MHEFNQYTSIKQVHQLKNIKSNILMDKSHIKYGI